MGQSLESLVRALRRAFDDNYVDGLLALSCPDLGWQPSAEHPLLEGEDAIRAFIADYTAAGSTMTATVTAVETVRDDHVVIHGRLRQESPGRIADEDVWWLCRFRDGMLARVEAHRCAPNVAA